MKPEAEAKLKEIQQDATIARLLGILAHKNTILAKASLNEAKIEETRAQFISQHKELKRKARKELAQELKTARKQLRFLQAKIREQNAFVRLFAASLLDRAPDYPPAPSPTIVLSEVCAGLPEASGIYFIWSEGAIVYVGQSINIAKRISTKSHIGCRIGDMASWLLFDKRDLNWAEAFYIGVHRPIRNFGNGYRLPR